MQPRTSSRPTLARRSHAKSRPAASANTAAAHQPPSGDECTIQVILPRRKAGQPETERDSEPVVLNRDVLESLFHLPLAAASGKLGLSATSIKKVCRRMGIIKWPYKSCRAGSKRSSGATSPTSSENSAAVTPPHHEASQVDDDDAAEEEGEEMAVAEAEEAAPQEPQEPEEEIQEAVGHRQEPQLATWEPVDTRQVSAELLAIDACYEEDLRTTQILDEYAHMGGRGGAWADVMSSYTSEVMRADDAGAQCLGDFLSFKYLSTLEYSA